MQPDEDNPDLSYKKKKFLYALLPFLTIFIVIIIIIVLRVGLLNNPDAPTTPKTKLYTVDNDSLLKIIQSPAAAAYDFDKVLINGSMIIDGAFRLGYDRPTSPQAGQLYFDNTSRLVYYYDGNTYVALTPGGNNVDVNDTAVEGLSNRTIYLGDVSGLYNNLQLGNSVVTNREIRDGTITGTDILNSSVTNNDLVNNSVTITAGTGLSGGGTVSLGGTISLQNVLGNSIESSEITDSTITFTDLGDNGCSINDIIKWDGSNWGCAIDEDSGGGGGGGDILQNGNSFGASLVIGSNDTFDLGFETDGVQRWFISTDGDFIPDGNDSYDIGNDTNRIQDLFLGPSTMHVGINLSQEGTVGYDQAYGTLLLGGSNGVVVRSALDLPFAFEVQNSSRAASLTVNTLDNFVTVNQALGIGLNPSINDALRIEKTFNTAVNNQNIRAINLYTVLNPGAGVTGTNGYGIQNSLIVDPSNTEDLASTAGIYSVNSYYAPGSLVGLQGAIIDAIYSGSGSVYSVIGGSFTGDAQGANLGYGAYGITADAKALNATEIIGGTFSTAVNFGGSVGTAMGIRVMAAQVPGGTLTDNYGIYQDYQDAGVNNYPLYFAGSIFGQPIVTIDGEGHANFHNNSDSTSAIKVQKADGTDVLTVDTVNSQLTIQGPAPEEIISPTELFDMSLCSGTNWVVSPSSATHTPGSTASLTCPSPVPTPGESYQFGVTVSGVSSSGALIWFAGTPWFAAFSNFTNSTTITAGSSATFHVDPFGSSFNGTISNVSIRGFVTQNKPTIILKDSAGSEVLHVMATTPDSLFMGYQAGFNNINGTNLTGIGEFALLSNTTGDSNSAFGSHALWSNSTGNNNAGFGSSVLFANTIGGDNSAFGSGAMSQNLSGNNNTAVGTAALSGNISGSDNVAIGRISLLTSDSGDENVAVGVSAMVDNVSGNNNTAVGNFSLNSNVTGSNNIGLGYFSDVIGTDLEYAAAIGSNSLVACDSCMVLGRGATHVSGGGETGPGGLYGGDKVGVNTLLPGAAFTVGNGVYSWEQDSRQITQSGTTVTSSGSAFEAEMVGGTFVYADGSNSEITAYNSATSIEVFDSQTIASPQDFYIVYPGGFNVYSDGVVVSRALQNRDAAFQVQNAQGDSILNIDTDLGYVEIGKYDDVAVLLVADQKYTVGDPFGVNGGLYVNSENRLRCFESNVWRYCSNGANKTLADRSTTSAAYSNVTDLDMFVTANTDYNFKCDLVFRSAALTTGFAFSMNGPASPSYIDYTVSYQNLANGSAADGNLMLSSHYITYDAAAASTSTVAANENLRVTIEGTFSNGASDGTLVPRFLTEVGGSAITVRKGSTCTIY